MVGRKTGDLTLTERDGHINMKSYWGSMRQSTYRLHLLAILITFLRSSLTDIRRDNVTLLSVRAEMGKINFPL